MAATCPREIGLRRTSFNFVPEHRVRYTRSLSLALACINPCVRLRVVRARGHISLLSSRSLRGPIGRRSASGKNLYLILFATRSRHVFAERKRGGRRGGRRRRRRGSAARAYTPPGCASGYTYIRGVGCQSRGERKREPSADRPQFTEIIKKAEQPASKRAWEGPR